MKLLLKDTLKASAVLRRREVYYYGFLLFAALFLLKLAEQRFMLVDHSYEVFGGGIALLFLLIGLWVSREIYAGNQSDAIRIDHAPGTVSPTAENVSAEISGQFISQREKEILELIAEGMSNQEIADRLFISLSTVKTHNQNLFMKLEVKRRTQAVEKAKRLKIIS